jgi:hypothetical protein
VQLRNERGQERRVPGDASCLEAVHLSLHLLGLSLQLAELLAEVLCVQHGHGAGREPLVDFRAHGREECALRRQELTLRAQRREARVVLAVKKNLLGGHDDLLLPAVRLAHGENAKTLVEIEWRPRERCAELVGVADGGGTIDRAVLRKLHALRLHAGGEEERGVTAGACPHLLAVGRVVG